MPKGRNASVGPLFGPGKESVDDFVRGAVTPDGDEFAVSARVGVAGNLSRLLRRTGLNDVQFYAARSQAVERRTHQLAAAAPASRGIDHSEKASAHKETTDARS